MNTIYHLVTKKDWEKNKKGNEYKADSLKTQGFIHCCHEDQIEYVVNQLFKDQKDLLLISIDPEKVNAKIKEDPVEDGELHSCPHIYGPVNLDAVVDIKNLNDSNY